MQRRKKPARWQLDLFIGVMIAAMLALLWVELPEAWYTIIDWVWSALTLAGMSVWVWFNRDALREEDQHARRKARQHPLMPTTPTPPRSLPLTPVQQHFLDVMDTQPGKPT
jgi:hypothetical protein